MNALLLSAGFGTRFRPHTDKLAKAALPLLNLPLLAYPLYYIESLDLERLVINLHHLPDTVMKAASSLSVNRNWELIFTHETPQILDSGGGVANALHHLIGKNDFIVANADSVIFFDHSLGFRPLLDHHRKEGAFATLLTCDKAGVGTQFGGVIVEPNGQVKGFSKNPKPEETAVHYAGVIVLSDRIKRHLKSGPSNLLYDVVTKAIHSGEKVIHYHEPKAVWFETGDLQSYLATTNELLDYLTKGEDLVFRQNLVNLLKNFRPHWKFERQTGFIWGSQQMVPATVTPSSRILVGENVKISPAARLEGFCVLGDNVEVGNSQLNDVVLGPNTHVEGKVYRDFLLS